MSAARKPTGGATRISIARITANCVGGSGLSGEMSGQITFTGPAGETVDVNVVLKVTYHTPGDPDWEDTNGTYTITSLTFNSSGVATVNYSIDFTKVPGANSYRTEVESVGPSSIDWRGTTTKGPSLPCGGSPTKASTLGTSLLAQLWLVATRQTQ